MAPDRRRLLPAAVVVVVAMITFAFIPPAARAAPGTPDDSAAPCAAAALFAVPATGETTATADPSTPVGLLGGLTTPLARRWGPTLDVVYVAYPATLDGPSYLTSEARGIAALTAATTAYAARCPRTPITLIGYSQGADVVSDLVHRASRGTVALAPDRIAGAVLLGNPRRDPHAPNLVPAPGRGLLGPRPSRELDVYRGRVYEVCAAADPICATESLDVTAFRAGLASGAHRSYATLPVGPAQQPLFEVLGAALDRLVGEAATPPTTTTPTTTTPTTTPPTP